MTTRAHDGASLQWPPPRQIASVATLPRLHTQLYSSSSGLQDPSECLKPLFQSPKEAGAKSTLL